MHFNRTQFATKRYVRLFALAILILVFLLSSCTVGDFDDLGNIFSTQYRWAAPPFSLPINSPRFTVDSIVYDSVSTYRVCSSIRSDSTIVLTGFTIHYWDTNGQSKPLEVRQDVVDTIDFRVHGPYVHKARITKIKGNTEYQVYGMASYLLGKDTTLVPSPSTSFRTP